MALFLFVFPYVMEIQSYASSLLWCLFLFLIIWCQKIVMVFMIAVSLGSYVVLPAVRHFASVSHLDYSVSILSSAVQECVVFHMENG